MTRERAEEIVSGVVMYAAIRQRRAVKRVRVGAQIFALLGTDPSWLQMITLDPGLAQMFAKFPTSAN